MPSVSLVVRLDARLVELDFGSWEMHHWDTIPRAQIDAWAADVALYRPGDGESVLGKRHGRRHLPDGIWPVNRSKEIGPTR